MAWQDVTVKALEGVVVGAGSDTGLRFTDPALMRSRTSIPPILANASNLSRWFGRVALLLPGFAERVLCV